MGFGVTILLALVVYIDVLQSQISVWSDTSGAPIIIWLFLISILAMGFYDKFKMQNYFFGFSCFKGVVNPIKPDLSFTVNNIESSNLVSD